MALLVGIRFASLVRLCMQVGSSGHRVCDGCRNTSGI